MTRSLAIVFSLLTLALSAQEPPRPAVNDDSQNHEHVSNVDKASEREVESQAAPLAAATTADVLTRSYDNLRSGATITETALTHDAVRAGLKERCSMTVGGDKRGFDAQPLFARQVRTQDGQTHDVMVTASLGNVVALFDAATCGTLWQRLLAPPVKSTRTIDAWQTNDNFGIISTGVLVRNAEQFQQATLYVVAWTSPDGTNARGVHKLYAISLYDGRDIKPPLTLPGSGTVQRKQRAALATFTYNGVPTLFVPFGTVQETATGAHGFVTAVDLNQWRVATEWNVTPTGKGGGIWQAGQGLIVDAEGYLYAMTSNGDYDGKSNFGESFVKLRYTGSAFQVIDHYSPFRDNARSAAYDDQDLGSGGPNLIPDIGLLFGAGKDGILYAMPWRQLARPLDPIWFTFYPGPNIPATKVYDQLFFQRTHHQHGSSVVAKIGNAWRVFCWGENGNLRAWSATAKGLAYLGNGQEVASAASGVPPGGMPGAFMAFSGNGQSGADGVLWATVPVGDANRTVTQGYLAAYDAVTINNGLIQLLWKSQPFTFSKFNPPVVWNGGVYVSTYDGRVIVFAR